MDEIRRKPSQTRKPVGGEALAADQAVGDALPEVEANVARVVQFGDALPEVESAVAEISADALTPAEQFERDLRAQFAHVSHLRQCKLDLEREIQAAQAIEDQMREALEAMRPPESPGDVIQGYLAAQRKVLEHRAEVKLALKDSGLNLQQLAKTLRAPIDAVRARKA